MTLQGGLALLGPAAVIAGMALIGFGGLVILAGYLADEIRIFCDVRGDWLGENSAHDHAADDDAHCLDHGASVDPETTIAASGNAPAFTGGHARG